MGLVGRAIAGGIQNMAANAAQDIRAQAEAMRSENLARFKEQREDARAEKTLKARAEESMAEREWRGQESAEERKWREKESGVEREWRSGESEKERMIKEREISQREKEAGARLGLAGRQMSMNEWEFGQEKEKASTQKEALSQAEEALSRYNEAVSMGYQDDAAEAERDYKYWQSVATGKPSELTSKKESISGDKQAETIREIDAKVQAGEMSTAAANKALELSGINERYTAEKDPITGEATGRFVMGEEKRMKFPGRKLGQEQPPPVQEEETELPPQKKSSPMADKKGLVSRAKKASQDYAQRKSAEREAKTIDQEISSLDTPEEITAKYEELFGEPPPMGMSEKEVKRKVKFALASQKNL